MPYRKSNLSQVRRRNLKRLIADYGSLSNLARKLGYQGPSYISQMVSGHREITERSAISIENTLRLTPGWMSQNHRGEGSTRPDIQNLNLIIESLQKGIDATGYVLSNDKYGEVLQLYTIYVSVTGHIDDKFANGLLKIAAP